MQDLHAFVATDRRLLILSVKFLVATTALDEALAPEPTSIDYRDIRRVEEHLGWFESELELHLTDTTIKLSSMRRNGARAVVQAVRRHAPFQPARQQGD